MFLSTAETIPFTVPPASTRRANIRLMKSGRFPPCQVGLAAHREEYDHEPHSYDLY